MIKKLFMGIVVVIVLGFVALFQFGGKAAESMIIELLAKQDTLQGSLEVANINADWSGKVILNDIIWRSDEKNNVIIAKIPSATVSVNLLEAILSGGNASSINDIVLDNPILYTGYQVDKGIEIVNNINFHEDSQKQDIKKTDFRGLIEVKDAVLEVMVGKEKLAFTNVQAQGNFKKYPTLKYNMHAKENNGDIILDITKENETLNILGDIKNIKVQNLLAFIPTLDGVVFKDGILQDCKITALKNSNDFTYSLDTVFSELQGEISQYQFSQGNGRIDFRNDTNEIIDFNFKFVDQDINIKGNIIPSAVKKEDTQYDLNINAPSFSLATISKGLGKSAVTLHGSVTGTLKKPIIEGVFGVDNLEVKPLNIADLSGRYSYENGKINLAEVLGSVDQGLLNLNGEIDTKTQSFMLELQGVNLDSSIVTETQVNGPLAFKMVLMGNSEASNLVGAGNFSIDKGSYMNIPFNSIDGVMTLQEEKFNFSNIRLNTVMGKFNTGLSIKDNGKLAFDFANLF